MFHVNPLDRPSSSTLPHELEAIAAKEHGFDISDLLQPYQLSSNSETGEELSLEFGILDQHRLTGSAILAPINEAKIKQVDGGSVVAKILSREFRRIRITGLAIATSILLVYVIFYGSLVEKFYSPGGVAGLVAWYNVASLDLREGDRVGFLADHSFKKSDASQGSIERRPVFRIGRASGYPVLEFDGVDDYFEADKIAHNLRSSSGVTLVYVAKANDKKSQHYILTSHLEDKSSNLFHTGFLDDNLIRVRTIKNPYPAGYHDSDPVLISALALYVVVLDARKVSVYQNGKRLFVDKINESIEYARASYFSIGQEYDNKLPADFYKGDLAEVLVYDRPLGDGERIKIEKLLAKKYRLSLREN